MSVLRFGLRIDNYECGMPAFQSPVKQNILRRNHWVIHPMWAMRQGVVPITMLVLSTCVYAQQPASPSGSAPDRQMLEQLVSEVRQLRLAIERTNSVSSRLQIILQRIQLQQNQVNRISGQLEVVRNQIATSEADQSQASSNLTAIESRIEQEQNPNTQKMLQEQQRVMKALVEQKSRVVQDERTREAELTSSIQIEQGKLGELQTRLDSLEKVIEPPPEK